MTTSHKTGRRIVDRETEGSGSAESFERLLWWLFAGTTGARNRLLVLLSIRNEPGNAQQLSHDLGLDYTTVRHHLRVLETNELVIAEGGKYGRMYFLSEKMDSHWKALVIINKRKPRRKERAGN
jgi:DNA-binding transcriptional ArsR family regulator